MVSLGIELPDDAIVVRGGKLQDKYLYKSAQEEFNLRQVWAVSGWAGSEVSVQDLASAGNIAHPVIVVTRVGILRRYGFEVTLYGDPRHCDIHLGGPPDDETWNRLREAFGDFHPNPLKVIEL